MCEMRPYRHSIALRLRAGQSRSSSTSPERLGILYVSQMPASPPWFGTQARGCMGGHDLTAVMLVDDEFDAEECRRAMQAYCREVVLVPNPHDWQGLAKRLRRS
jgi:polysaccharide biosynthesis protein PslH